MAVKIKKWDAVFSQIIRTRAKWMCEVCGKPGQGSGLHCSHFYSRRHQATRYDPDNAAAMCFGCHQKMGGNPILFQNWIEDYLGSERYSMLNEKHHRIVKRTKKDKDELYKHLKGELAKLKQDSDYNPVSYD